jgi:O-6-methylguanine DNA methyltransferase
MNVWLALHFPAAAKRSGVTPILKKTASQLDAYFTSAATTFSIPLDLVGTQFQTATWTAVTRIPFGETRTYREVAELIERPRAFRAVGSAQAANPVPIVVPCHRVITADGALGGYAGTQETKRWLLEHEASRASRVSAPRPLADAAPQHRRRRPARRSDNLTKLRPQF